jgi:kynurenine formamidase
MRIVDLSRELYHRTPSYPGQPPIIHGIWKTHDEARAETGGVHGNSVMFFSMPDHGGTHIDAPRHFGKSGTPINEYPLENCIVQGICIDLRHPGVNVAATEWLAKQGIVHFGIDSMRPGPEGMVNTLVHKACLELDITHIESLCNLESLLGKGEFQFIGLPLKWREGTGSPIRAVAVFDN